MIWGAAKKELETYIHDNLTLRGLFAHNFVSTPNVYFDLVYPSDTCYVNDVRVPIIVTHA